MKSRHLILLSLPQQNQLKTKLISTLILLVLSVVSLGLHAQSSNKTIEWDEALDQNSQWYASEEAIRIADNLIIYQHKSGGWPKNIDMANMLSDEDISTIREAKQDKHVLEGQPTIDNEATYTQMRFLAQVYERTNHERFKDSFIQGLDYLLEAQYDNGGWPQFYPIRKGYYEYITFNDGAMIGVMKILRATAKGEYYFVDSVRTAKAQTAIDKGLEVILKTQIRVDGELTAWCAQHDPTSFEPVEARTYELPSISGSESVGIVKYLMEIDHPSEKIIQAVNSAVEWFERVKITGVRLIKKEDSSLPQGYDIVVGFDPENASPLWGRFYQIGTNYPMFVDRDGVVKYALSEIKHERRVNYSWLGNWAEELIQRDYPEWQKKHHLNVENKLSK